MADEQAPPFMSRQQAGDGGVSKVRASWDENEEQTRMETPQQPLFFSVLVLLGRLVGDRTFTLESASPSPLRAGPRIPVSTAT